VLVFLFEWLFVVAMLVGFGAVGAFAVMPFRERLPFALLASPFAGLLVMAFGTGVAYQLLGQPFLVGFLATAAAGMTATAVVGVTTTGSPVRWTSRCHTWRSLAVPGGLAMVLAGIVTAITASAAIEVGSPALLYWTGTDHLGYAHPADWILAHPPSDRPRVDPAVPYESWPALMLESDPRFGSLALVAMIGLIRGLPGTFAYEAACAVALSAAILGVAAVFARSRLTLLLLVLGLLACHWYDYSRAGYLGRVLGYPATCLVLGLLLAARSPLRPWKLVPLLLVACGAAVVYPADGTVMFVGVVGGLFVVASLVLSREPVLRRLRCVPWQHAAVLGLIVLVALFTKSGVARRWSPEGGQGGSLRTAIVSLVDPSVEAAMAMHPWEQVRPTLLDLEQAHAPIGMLPRDLLNSAILLARGLWLAVIAVAVVRRDPAALALSLGPLLLLTTLNALPTQFARWATEQLPGTFYPLTLGAAALLLDGARPRIAPKLATRGLVVGLTALLVLSTGLRLPRFVGSVDRYVGTGTRTLPPFSLVEMDALATAVGSEPVWIDVDEPHLALVALVELSRRGIEMQWGPRAWFHVASYRGWPPPESAMPAPLSLESVDEPPGDRSVVVYQTPHYRLVRDEERTPR